jgi:hypothetical protein
MNPRALLVATAIGAVAQLAMVVAGHFMPIVKEHGLAIGGVLISLLAASHYVRLARGGWGDSLAGGAIVGGACALIGIAVSLALGDVPADILLYGTLASTAAGVLGGAIRKWSISMGNPQVS